MKQIVIISGKGGTGKTVITGAFAALAKNKVMADCDVDAADLHLLLSPVIKQRHEFRSGKTAKIDKRLCKECGKCISVCRFNAIRNCSVDPISCEGCGVCVQACPEKAISLEQHRSGQWFISDTRCGPMIHAQLGIGEDNSGKLVSLVRQQAKLTAESAAKQYVLIDGPPGIGCPVIAAITGVDLVLAVTEPTLSGIHDLKRVVGVASHFSIPVVVCINKYDINLENSLHIEEYCASNNLEVLGKIPYDQCVTKAMVNKKSVIEYPCGEVTKSIEHLWTRVRQKLH